MKKLLLLLLALTFTAGFAMTSHAALVTITFDEAGITSGPTNDRYDGTQISTQYSYLGVTWEDSLPANSGLTGQGVVLPSEFSGSNWGTNDQMIWYYGTGGSGTTPTHPVITLSNLSDALSFEYRRPNATGSMTVKLYKDSSEIYSGTFAVGNTWNTFNYSGNLFNKVDIQSNDKFNSDNYSFNMVPIPSSIWLMAAGMIPLFLKIRKRTE